MTSRSSKRRPAVLVGGLIGLILVTGALLPALSSTPTREVALVVKGMAFHLEGDPRPNPTIDVRAGERVRVVVRNEDRGLTHDFAVTALRRATRAIEWSQSAEISFDAPARPGDYEYVCQPHRLMMRGTIRVRP
jgi:plastocyanin